jgi:peptidoglycan pentaglycine glycine transferase (the first glycine)
MTTVTQNEWKAFITNHPDAHLLQTGEWGELKASFGWMPLRIISENSGVQILFKKLPLGFTIAYIPRGPVGDLPREAWAEIAAMCKERNAVFIKVEPDNASFRSTMPTKEIRNWKMGTKSIQPMRTILVDLSGMEDEILARMKQKCRYNIRLAEKKDIVIKESENIDTYYELMLATGKRDDFGVHSKDYFQKVFDLFYKVGACALLIAEFNEKPLAGLLVFKHGKRAWYLFGASNDEERNRMPTYLLQWEAMRWAKRNGCTEYDLWGVPDEDEETLEREFESRSDGLWGVYRFKRGFGGRLFRSAPVMDCVFNPFLYWLYQIYTNTRGQAE